MYYREGNVRISSAYDIDHDTIVLQVHIPKNDLVKMDRRDFANMMYDIMVAPLDEEADKDRALAIRARHDQYQRDRDIGVIPDGWFVLYCAECKRSVSWTEDDARSYDDDWINGPPVEILEHQH